MICSDVAIGPSTIRAGSPGTTRAMQKITIDRPASTTMPRAIRRIR